MDQKPTPTQEELKLAWEITSLTSALSEKMVASAQMALAARTRELAECRAQADATQTELVTKLTEKTQQLQDHRRALSLAAEQRDRNATEREQWKAALMQVAVYAGVHKAVHTGNPSPDTIALWIQQAIKNKPAKPKRPGIDLIEDQEISVRLAACLQDIGIETVQQLAERSGQDLLKTKNLGNKTLKEAKELLAKFGLEFREPG